MKIRPAEEKDLPQLIALMREFAEFENLAHLFKAGEKDLQAAIFGAEAFVHCLVAESGDGALAAYAMFFPVFKTFRGERSMFLEDLYVAAEMRGRGLGLALLKQVARLAKEKRCVRMDWQALRWNAPAVEFYKRIGAALDDENLDFALRGAAFENLQNIKENLQA